MAASVHHHGSAAVNPAGGTKIVENRTNAQKRFLANRNRLLAIAKNSQHLLLLMLIPCLGLVLLEGLATFLMTQSGSLVKSTCLDALAEFWRLRGHVRAERRRIKSFRRHGDFWMLRFLRFGFGRWHEVEAMWKRGFPKFNRG